MSSLDSSFFQRRLREKISESISKPLPDSTIRRIYTRTSMPGKVTAVVGMRRAGKTTFLHQLRRESVGRGISVERLPYINFEDETLSGMDSGYLGSLVEDYYRRFPQFRNNETITWFFDEIQLIPGWERFVRRLMDSEKVEIFITGSSASLLSREIATSLRGRAWEVIIHPFSFEEFLRHKHIAIPEDIRYPAPGERSLIEQAFMEYLTSGGFPEAQDLDTASRFQLLKDYVDVAILRDVVERHSITNIVGLRWMVRHLLGNAASSFSVEKFYNSLKSQGIAISKDTVHNLLAYLEDCFMVRTVWMDTESERQRMVNPRKSYPVDTGLIPLYDRSARANLGHLLETIVMVELERRRYDVTYVRTTEGYEVDFLVRIPGSRSQLIQVCADASNPSTAEREIRALLKAAEKYGNAQLRLLTLTQDSSQVSVPEGIIVQPAYEWLLDIP